MKKTGILCVRRVLIASVLACGVATASASEWTSWRGPAYNGSSTETNLVSSWSPEGENLIWFAEFIGRSTPVVVDGRVCVIGRTGEEKIDRQEVVACYDAGDGKKLWERRHNVYMTTVPYNRVGWASLAADPETGNVYAHGVAGQLIAYAPDGKILWSRFLTEELGRLSGYGGRTQTPLIDGDQLIVSFISVGWGQLGPLRHRYWSFDKKTGEPLWVATPGKMAKDFNTQGGPVIAEVAGRRLLISGNGDGWVYAMEVATGKTIWSFQLSKRGINVTPVVSGNTVFISHSEENLDAPTMGRMVAIDATGTGDVTKTHEKWRIDEMGAGFPSPVYHEGVVYQVDNSANLHAIDAASGTVKWSHSVGTVGKASPVVADGKIYLSETNGRFHILKPGPDGVEQLDLDELTIDGGDYAEFYGSPAIAYGRVYFATEGGVYCLGDKSRPFQVDRSRPSPASKSTAKAVTLQVVPAEVQLEFGDSIDFRVRLLDANGQVVQEQPAIWSLEGLEGKVSPSGRFVSSGAEFQAGKIVAKVGELTGAARARVYAPFPWQLDFDSYETGQFPPHWIGANRIYLAGEREGEKVLTKAPRGRGLNRTFLYMGAPWMSNYTIEADILGEAKGRRRADIGLINSGYILDLQGSQTLQVRSWSAELRMAKEVDFAWEPSVWYRIKLKVVADAEKATVYGKVWRKSDAEPEAWTITVEDPHPIQAGTPGLLGYSPVHLYYDNILVTPNEG